MTEPPVYAPGAEIAGGRYKLDRVLGRGGMAAVWLAHDQRLDRPVAVKVIADTIATDRDYLRRFAREARLAAGLTHPNLVDVYDFSESPPFLVMEYVDGGTLADHPPPDAGALARDLLSALDTVHRAGILHRDIKPANVLLGRDGRVRLTDFGIARGEDTTHLTRTGQVIGTLRYMAPEVARGEPATPQSDLYSLGQLIAAFGGPGVLVRALTATDPADRPASAPAALALLDEATEPLPTRVLAPPARARPFLPLALGALGVLLLVLALAAALTAGDGPASPLDERFDRVEQLIQDAER